MVSKVKLGDFEFQHAEIPDSLPFGGRQSIAKLIQVGGDRVLQAMGRDDRDIEWSGIFVGRTSHSRAQYIDNLRVAGNPLIFSYFDRSFRVLISNFEPAYEQAFYVPYSITLVIQEDLSNPTTIIKPAGYLDNITQDLNAALDIAEVIRYPNITVALEVLDGYLGLIQPSTNITFAISNEIEKLIEFPLQLVGDAIGELADIL